MPASAVAALVAAAFRRRVSSGAMSMGADTIQGGRRYGMLHTLCGTTPTTAMVRLVRIGTTGRHGALLQGISTRHGLGRNGTKLDSSQRHLSLPSPFTSFSTVELSHVRQDPPLLRHAGCDSCCDPVCQQAGDL